MKLALVILVLLVPAWARATLELTAVNPFTRELVYVDWSTLVVDGPLRRVWELADWGVPDENGVRFAYGEHEYHCV